MEDDDRNCRLKISVENFDSEDDQSDDDGGGFIRGRKGKKTDRPTGRGSRAASPDDEDDGRSSSAGSTDGNHSRDRESDGDTISVAAVDSRGTKVPEPRIKTYKNEAGTFVVGFDVTSQECKERQELRAKRFGDSVSTFIPVTDEAIQKLYESLGVSPSSDNGENVVRFDAVHVRGVDEMSTSRVFSYFGEFAPAAIEWIDDTSCNVVWMDTMMAVRALLKLSYDPTSSENPVATSPVSEEKDDNNGGILPASNLSDGMQQPTENSKVIEIEDDDDLNLMSDDDDDDAKHSHSIITAEENRAEKRNHRLSVAEKNSKPVKIDAEDEAMEVDEDIFAQSQPDLEKQSSVERKVGTSKKKIQKIRMNENDDETPPGKWRIGISHPRAKRLFMRFATKADVKQPGAGRRSKYYQKYGNPNFGGIKGIISESRKRKIFSKQYQVELEEARKAIEEAKWKRGIPDETKFDQHVDEVVLKREQTKKEPVAFIYSGDESEGSTNGLVVESVDAPPKKKRFMKMHADEMEERSLSRRLGPCNYTSSKSNVWDRLGVGSQSRKSASISHRERSSGRKIGDLRNRLNQR